VALFVGVLGATLAGPPLRIAVDAFGWRGVMGASAVVTGLVALAIWLVVRDDPAEQGYASFHAHAPVAAGPRNVTAQLREVFSYRNTWLLFLVPGAFSGILLTFAGLWGVPFLATQYGFSTRSAATVTSGMLVAWSVSSMVYGPLSERMGRRKPLYIGGLAATTALWSVVVFIPGLPPALLVAVLLALSLAAGSFILTFAFARESVPARVAGTASGVANMGVMLGGMFMQPLVGLVLDWRWQGRMADGVRLYDFAAYQWGFALMLAWGFAGLAMLAFVRESYCKPLS
jgi:MFS family permease